MANEKVCPQCNTRYEADNMFCSIDGAALIQAQNSTDLVGSIIADRYRVVSKLGDGGMGQVYLAEHVRMKRRCAVKIMRPALMSDPVAIVRFNREAENASQISHPNVCAVYDFGETPTGLIYLAMEFIDGEPLSKVLAREGFLLPVRAADVISQTADALSAAHGLGILHRDLKPDNIMIAKSRAGTDHVKIVDFGIARVMSKDSQNLTSTGIAVGTPEYMSPEQFAGDTLDARTDIYSLALVAYHVLTGGHAFGSGTTTDHLLARLTQPPRRLTAVKGDVEWPERLQATFDRALAADPSERYADVIDFARDFTDAVADMPVTTTEEYYLNAIASRRLTPPRSFTPARGVPTMELSTGGPPDAGDGEPSSEGADGWADSGAAVAVTTPSGERPTEKLTPSDITVARGDIADGASGPGGDDPPVVATPTPAGPAPAYAAPPSSSRGRNILMAVALLLGVTLTALLIVRPRASGDAVSNDLASAPAAVGDSAAAAAAAAARADSAPSDSLAADSTHAADSASVPTPGMRALDSAVTRMRAGVVAVVSSAGRGSGFLADTAGPTGLVVTSAGLVPSDSVVDVQFDGSTRVRARVAAADRGRGVAVLAVALRPWSAHRALPIAASDSALQAGDSLAALGAAFAGPVVRRGAARAGEGGAVRPGVSIGRADAGRPVISATASVVALATTRGAQPTFATSGTLAEILRTARARVSGSGFTAPSDAVLPAWPFPAYPLEPFRTASRADSLDLTPYRTTTQGYRILLMTPKVLAWRDSAIARTEAYWKSPFQIGRTPYPYELFDPIQRWGGFSATVRERRPVIVLSVVPQGVPELRYRQLPPEPAEVRNAVGSFRLMRDGREVAALDSARFPAVINPNDYQARRRPVRDEAVGVYRLDAFAAPGTYTVEIADGSRRVAATLPQPLVDALRRDAAPWRPSR